MKRLVLASGSPRRQEVLEQLGLSFEVIKSDVDEAFPKGYTPEQTAVAVALRKVRYVAKKLKSPALVVGADTIVVLKGEIMGKPVDTGQAFQMIKKLAGEEHTVITGVAVADSESGEERTGYQTTLVKMKDICPERIKRYVSTGEPLDKAGAYAVQGKAAVFIEGIKGCYFNVVGLPITTLDSMFQSLGMDLFQFSKSDKS
ncbi:MAG: Maf family protein [Firmicutes bacterium]|nr:Maf family protein [Bacillota bacterium]